MAEDLPAVDARRAALYRVADEGRRLIDALVASPATEEQLRAAADAMAAIVDSLPVRAPGLTGRTSEASLGPSRPSISHSQNFLDHSPVIGLANPIAPPLHLRDEGDHVTAVSRFGTAYEGPPGHVHGGWIAAAFDEVLGRVQALTGKPGMTGWLNVKYHRPTPLYRELFWEGRITKVEGRKIFTAGDVRDDEGRLLAEAEALFISIDFAKMAVVVAEAAKKAGFAMPDVVQGPDTVQGSEVVRAPNAVQSPNSQEPA